MVAQALEAFLLMEGEGVVDFATDAAFLHVRHEGFAVFGIDDELVVDVEITGLFGGWKDAAAQVVVFEVFDGAGESGRCKGFAVEGGVLAALFVPGVEVL